MNKMKVISTLDGLDSFQFQKIKLRNSMDRYGFSYVLANSLGINKPPRSFCNWVHGWVWWEDIMESRDIVGTHPFSIDVPIVVATNQQKKVILDHGYNDIYVGGVPYVYCPEFNIQKCPNTLLAILSHSAESESHEVLDERYLDYLSSLRNEWESIFVSIFYLDKSDKLIHEIERRGLKAIIGANPHDRFSMLRTKLMFTIADAVNSNVMGSHIAYALSNNCKVSLVDDLYKYEPLITIKSNQGHIKKDIDRYLYASSVNYLNENFKYLFKDPLDGVRDINLGNKYLGRDDLLQGDDLKTAIGWKTDSQLKGYFKGFKNRAMSNFIKNKKVDEDQLLENWNINITSNDANYINNFLSTELSILICCNLNDEDEDLLTSLNEDTFDAVDFILADKDYQLGSRYRDKFLQLESNINEIIEYLSDNHIVKKLRIFHFSSFQKLHFSSLRKIQLLSLKDYSSNISKFENIQAKKVLVYIDTFPHLRKTLQIQECFPGQKFNYITHNIEVFSRLNQSTDFYVSKKSDLLKLILNGKLKEFDAILTARVDEINFQILHKFSNFKQLLTFDEGLYTVQPNSIYNSQHKITRKNGLKTVILNKLIDLPKPASYFYFNTDRHFTWFPKERFSGLPISQNKLINLDQKIYSKEIDRIFIGQPWQFMNINIFSIKALAKFINSSSIDIYLVHPREDLSVLDRHLDLSISRIICQSPGEDFMNRLLANNQIEVYTVASTIITHLSNQAKVKILESKFFDEQISDSQKNLKETLLSENRDYGKVTID